MTSEKGSRKDKNQNIQVFVRLRPLNQRERDLKSLGVVEVLNNREVVVRQSQQVAFTKKFTFDKAFGPHAKQVEVYQEVVSPLIEEVLAGYNCTVFAYGQTGTGKTHTMVGENTGLETSWQNDPLAGIIPRALSQLFDELRISNTEYTVRVSYLELYNEELFDLLSTSEDNSKLRIYEDITRKGSNIVNGLEEITVYNKNEVYKIMAQGHERKKVASTLMNAQSSRSHTVFTILVHMKENSPDGEEFVKIGKLNLVDLAGSENISKAGSDNPSKRERARECVNINQSLLTLGRVITALVERHPHIPYRESKLTRILQESLGGRTKTSIIATISPGHKDLEETMSTLEYAHRAKNIQNKPEINQKMTKKAILKEYSEEIDKLKRDLQAARDKNGIYIAHESYAEMNLMQEEQRKEIQALLLKKRAMEEEKEKMESVFLELNTILQKREIELNNTKQKLDCTTTKLVNTSNLLKDAKLQCLEQSQLVSAHATTEQTLGQQAKEILQAADAATEHLHLLHDTVDRRKNVECKNLEVTRSYREQAAYHRQYIVNEARDHSQSLTDSLKQLHQGLDKVTTSNIASLEQDKQKLKDISQKLLDTINELSSLSSSTSEQFTSIITKHQNSFDNILMQNHNNMQELLRAFLDNLNNLLADTAKQDVTGVVDKYLQTWYCGAVSRVTSMQAGWARCAARAQLTHARRAAAAHSRAARSSDHAHARRLHLHAHAQELEEEKSQITARFAQQMQEIEDERIATAARLQQWMQDERKAFEMRLQQHVESETKAMEERLTKKLQEIEEGRSLFEKHLSRLMESQKTLLASSETEEALVASQLEEDQSNVKHDMDVMKEYDVEFDEGISAIKSDLEALTVSLVELVDHSYSELLHKLTTHTQSVKTESDSLMVTDDNNCKQVIKDTDETLNNMLEQHKQLSQHVVATVQENSTSTIEELDKVSESLDLVRSACTSHVVSHSSAVDGISSRVSNFEGSLRETVGRLEHLEGKCLNEEYKVYSPTGRTPCRREYRYPRELARTSPHQHILARLREQLNNTEQECILVESDECPSPSECESSSEDSSLFVAPLTTPQTYKQNIKHEITKSISESDIPNMKKIQYKGVENNTGSTNKKPSKLPAAMKKPLVERNGTIN